MQTGTKPDSVVQKLLKTRKPRLGDSTTRNRSQAIPFRAVVPCLSDQNPRHCYEVPTVSKTEELHDQALDLAVEAIAWGSRRRASRAHIPPSSRGSHLGAGLRRATAPRLEPDPGELKLWNRAFKLEEKAVRCMVDKSEPSLSILLRSAATMALRGRAFQDASRLAHEGLAGSPPPEIADELQDILLQVQEATGTEQTVGG